MAARKSDWAIREEKNSMLRAVNLIKQRWAKLDSLEWTLSQNPQALEAALAQYKDQLRKPLLRFFAGAPMEEMTVEAHNQFIRSLRQYVQSGAVKITREVSVGLLESLQSQIMRNIDTLLSTFDGNILDRARQIKAIAAENAGQAVLAELQTIQLKIENITARTTGASDLKKAWSDLQGQYGTRETVKYRDGKNYPLTTYLDGRANSTSADIHRLTTQYDATQAGIFTGKISSHGAIDSCRPYEGKIVFFTESGRDILSQKYPQARNLKTVDELKNDRGTHLWKFNCRHIVTPYPIQFFDEADAVQELAA